MEEGHGYGTKTRTVCFKYRGEDKRIQKMVKEHIDGIEESRLPKQ